ncbi:MAG: CpsD/CapB family tyrosine-protein kinase [Christensenellaceae bacterium]
MKSISNFFANLRRKKQQKQYAEAHRDTIRSTYLLDKTTPFAVREARNLKASISIAIPKEGISLLCTSTFPEEGKTTVTVNLALMFAMSKVKVVLLDADIRKGRVSKYFGAPHKPGLSDYLSGQAKFEDILHQSKEHENLYIIYQGTASPRPYELLESEAMREFSEKLKKEFDYIIYDTPPIQLVSDALLIPLRTAFGDRHMKTYGNDIKASLIH